MKTYEIRELRKHDEHKEGITTAEAENKQKIKVVVKEVTPHGQIFETKVYDWVSMVTDTASPSEEKTTTEIFQVQHNFAPGGEDF
ncbi:hypothetical protein Nepgr_027140 [Nepenthes gracilis]|uniref:Uncharacterized protein n=1 Tax=Nepenthes gracilis TaxID=150966 RepID=A0AAD3T9H7_NEPGR|nr:hypothetical protein Nepgr_027140 [Nepenthes gracilis]